MMIVLARLHGCWCVTEEDKNRSGPVCVLDGLNGLVNGGRGRRRRLDPSHTLLGSWRLESPASCCRVDVNNNGGVCVCPSRLAIGRIERHKMPVRKDQGIRKDN